MSTIRWILSSLTGADDFDNLITLCDDVVRQENALISLKEFQRLESSIPAGGSVMTDLYKVYCGMKTAFSRGAIVYGNLFCKIPISPFSCVQRSILSLVIPHG